MRKITALIAAGAIISVMMAVDVSAACYRTPLGACAGVTGESASYIAQQRYAGAAYGSLAQEAGKLDDYHEAILEMQKERFSQLVREGRLPQEQADEMLKIMEEQQYLCEGIGDCLGAEGGCGYGYGYVAGGHHSSNYAIGASAQGRRGCMRGNLWS